MIFDIENKVCMVNNTYIDSLRYANQSSQAAQGDTLATNVEKSMVDHEKCPVREGNSSKPHVLYHKQFYDYLKH